MNTNEHLSATPQDDPTPRRTPTLQGRIANTSSNPPVVEESFHTMQAVAAIPQEDEFVKPELHSLDDNLPGESRRKRNAVMMAVGGACFIAALGVFSWLKEESATQELKAEAVASAPVPPAPAKPKKQPMTKLIKEPKKKEPPKPAARPAVPRPKGPPSPEQTAWLAERSRRAQDKYLAARGDFGQDVIKPSSPGPCRSTSSLSDLRTPERRRACENAHRRAMVSAQHKEDARPWTLGAHRVMTLRLEAAMDSAHPGPVLAQVVAPVFDDLGHQVVIPSGSRILGNLVVTEQRVGMRFTTLIITHQETGASRHVTLTATPSGLSPERIPGLEGKVDAHITAKAGAVALSAGIAAGQGALAAVLPPASLLGGTQAVSAGVGSAAASTGNIGQQVAAKELARPDRVRLAAGAELRVMLQAPTNIPKWR